MRGPRPGRRKRAAPLPYGAVWHPRASFSSVTMEAALAPHRPAAGSVRWLAQQKFWATKLFCAISGRRGEGNNALASRHAYLGTPAAGTVNPLGPSR